MATLTVRKNGTGQYTQINDAILSAVYGDTIDIGPGTYLENVDLYKGITLQGSGKDQTFIQGKLTGDTFTGTRTLGSKFITSISSADIEKLIAGRVISGTGIATGTRIDNIDAENNRIELNVAATASGTTALTLVAIPQGSILAKQQSEIIAATFVADSDPAYSLYTLSRAPAYALRVGDKLIVGANERQIVEVTSATTGKMSGLPLANGNTTLAHQAGYWAVKDLCVLGYDGATPSDAGAFFIASPSLGGFKQMNWLIDNCRIVADGDHGLVSSGNLSSDGGTVQNCLFEGKTYVGDEPAEVPAFSSFSTTGSVAVVNNETVGISFPSTNGMVVGALPTTTSFRSGLSSGTTVVSIVGNIVTVNLPTETLTGAAFTAARVSGSNQLTVAAGIVANLRVGLLVSGTGIAAGSKITALDASTNKITLSANATSTGSAAVTPINTFTVNGDGSVSYVLAKDPRAVLAVGDKFIVGATVVSVTEVTDVRTGKISGSLTNGSIKIAYHIAGGVGAEFQATFINVQFTVPNVARQMVCIGNSGSVTNCLNTTFKGNKVKGRTGAVIAASGAKTMFNAAITVDTVGGLIEDNVIDGNFGAGPNTLGSNLAIRSRGAGVIVRNNTNKVFGGRGNSGFFAPLAAEDTNNVTIDVGLVTPTQEAGEGPKAQMSKAFLKTLPAVSSSQVFSDDTNWSLVAFVYKHSGSSKRIVGSFKSFEEGKEVQMRLKSGMDAGQSYQLIKVILLDQERNRLVVRRAQVEDASSYDFTLL